MGSTPTSGTKGLATDAGKVHMRKESTLMVTFVMLVVAFLALCFQLGRAASTGGDL